MALGKAAFAAPLYISVAWTLIISYQLFTQTAVYSAINSLSSVAPSTGALLVPRIDTIAFIHAFAWIFVLASVIPSVILGKSRSVLLQFFICLSLTLVAVFVEDILSLVAGGDPTAQVSNMAVWFQNPIVAGLYLSVPYVFMLYLDIHSRREKKKEEVEESGEPEKPQEVEESGEPEKPQEVEESGEPEKPQEEGEEDAVILEETETLDAETGGNQSFSTQPLWQALPSGLTSLLFP